MNHASSGLFITKVDGYQLNICSATPDLFYSKISLIAHANVKLWGHSVVFLWRWKYRASTSAGSRLAYFQPRYKRPGSCKVKSPFRSGIGIVANILSNGSCRFHHHHLISSRVYLPMFHYNPSSVVLLDNFWKHQAMASQQIHSPTGYIRRSKFACVHCHRRKVRCNASAEGIPCTNCKLDRYDCKIHAKQKRVSSQNNKASLSAVEKQRGLTPSITRLDTESGNHFIEKDCRNSMSGLDSTLNRAILRNGKWRKASI